MHARAQPNLEGYEIHQVPLVKKEGQSLGISIIGHNPLSSQGETGSDVRHFPCGFWVWLCITSPALPPAPSDAVGVYVKHVVPGSAADQSGNIRVQDRLIAVRAPTPPRLGSTPLRL